MDWNVLGQVLTAFFLTTAGGTLGWSVNAIFKHEHRISKIEGKIE